MYDLILKRNVLKIRVKNKYDVKKKSVSHEFQEEIQKI